MSKTLKLKISLSFLRVPFSNGTENFTQAPGTSAFNSWGQWYSSCIKQPGQVVLSQPHSGTCLPCESRAGLEMSLFPRYDKALTYAALQEKDPKFKKPEPLIYITLL